MLTTKFHSTIKLLVINLFIINLFSCAHIKKELSGSNEYRMGAVLWVQTSAEYRALCYQAYNLAKLRLDQELSWRTKDTKKKVTKRRPAMVLDLDETVLDNGTYWKKMFFESRSESNVWKDWESKFEAKAVPGALEFVRYADAKKVAIFYVSNRSVDDEDATLNNLIKLGLPVSKNGLLLRTDSTSKKERFDEIRKKYEIVLMVGDNLRDFTHLYDNKTIKARSKVVDSFREEFGRRFILIPNPIYGDWERAIYSVNSSSSSSSSKSKSVRDRENDRHNALLAD